MHSLVKERLEELLAVEGHRASDAGVEAHLAGCEACRRELDSMRAQVALFKSLRPPTDAEPHPGFYACVMDRIETQRRPSFWGAFLEPGFSRRIVFASLVFLVLFGGYLGMFTGYSTLALADALPKGGTIVACEIDPVAADIAIHEAATTPLQSPSALNASTASLGFFVSLASL